MARRFDQYYQVKPRDNLGDPEYWNRRFDDIDRRVWSNEDGLDAIGGLTAYVEGLALDRLDLVLAPALDKITLVSQQGFLLAHSTSSITLDSATTQVFAIPDEAERELFAPSPFVTIVREANQTDYAFARLVDWNRMSGQLTLQPIQIWGNQGPFDDWVIYVGTALSQAIQQMLADTQAARDAANGYRDNAATSATQTVSDKTAVAQMKSDTLAARDAAAASALAAKTWDPTGYIAKDAAGTYSQTITFGASPIVPTPTSGDNSQKAASTGFVSQAVSQALTNLTGYIAKDAAGTYSQTITFGASPIVPTPTSGDNSQKAASTGFVSQAVSQAITNLVAASPAALDTLKELATALGNDPNFATTIAGQIGGKLSKSGDTMAGDLTIYRPASPTTGVVFLGNSGSHYLYFDGANYSMPTSNLYVNGGLVYTSANYTPPAAFQGLQSARWVDLGYSYNPIVGGALRASYPTGDTGQIIYYYNGLQVYHSTAGWINVGT